jgi:dATP pyrophosphohydrolase
MSEVDDSRIEIVSPGVNIAVVKKDDDGWKVLVLQRAETESYPGCWGLLTGRKEKNEVVAQVVARELMVRVGLTAERIWATEYLIRFYEPEFDQIWIMPLIVAVVDADVEVVLQPEHSGYRWLDPFGAKKQVTWKNLVRAIEDVAEELEVYPARTWIELVAK